jgi:AcrR family transcriptional regulator
MVADGTKRPLGRPPKVSRGEIVEAACSISLSDLTLKAVADELGVSVAALYYHIDSKDDLLRLVAEYWASQSPTPRDRGQHWTIWLLEWAVHSRNAFLVEPGLLAQYLDGAVSHEAIAENLDRILGGLVGRGFAIREAQHAYAMVSTLAVGSAVNELHNQGAERAGRPIAAEFPRILSERTVSELPHLRALIAEFSTAVAHTFVDSVATALVGIAVDRGEDAATIRRRIRSSKIVV